VVGFWKRGTRKGAKIAAADFGAAAAPVYKFPSGSLFATLAHGISTPFGLTISRPRKSQRPDREQPL
jgi:hypothetical protein